MSAPPVIKIHVNGEIKEVPAMVSISQLISHLNLAPERLAIELNREVVRRTTWETTLLKDGDRIEIVHFVGGGRV
jgi:thiamine biosynthesis protein ThiS